MTLRRLLTVFVLIIGIAPAMAVRPDEQLPDPEQEARARRISAGIRCLVCQNQSIDDSDAGLAEDLRRLVRERILAGDSDGQIRDFLVARYGEFVLLKPSLTAQTLLLWGLPVFALLAGAGAAFRLFRRRVEAEGQETEGREAEEQEIDAREAGDPGATLSEAEKAELDRILHDRQSR